MYSVDFAEIEKLQHEGRWNEATEILIKVAKILQISGADFIVICTNTMHKMADAIEKTITIPLLHIVDVTAHKIKQEGFKRVGLLGTRFTMEQDFYKERFHQKHNIEIVVPDIKDRIKVHSIIFDELCLGKINPDSKESILSILERLKEENISGIILGCTELGLLLKQSDIALPLYDTTHIHALAAVAYAL
jgi:aspartate racemase